MSSIYTSSSHYIFYVTHPPQNSSPIPYTTLFRSLLLRRGQYQGPVTIETPVTIRGEPGTVISGDGRGSVIEIVADDVRLERLIIRRSGRDLSKDDAGILVLGEIAVLKDLVLRENLHGVYLLSADDARLSGL